jgi:hypothetical protein
MIRRLIPFIAAVITAIAIGVINPSIPIPNQAAFAEMQK